jgi:hypothetical protein
VILVRRNFDLSNRNNPVTQQVLLVEEDPNALRGILVMVNPDTAAIFLRKFLGGFDGPSKMREIENVLHY